MEMHQNLLTPRTRPWDNRCASPRKPHSTRNAQKKIWNLDRPVLSHPLHAPHLTTRNFNFFCS